MITICLMPAPEVGGKMFLGWLYRSSGSSGWGSSYWSSSRITRAMDFKADYTDSFTGSGTETAPYQIGSVEDLQKLASVVNKDVAAFNNSGVYYKLTADIDLSTVCGVGTGSWTPIGNSDYYFKANLDGSSKTISNLYINTSSRNQGLFGYLSGTTVKNLTLTGSVSAGDNSGALAGIIDNSTVEHVDVSGVTVAPYGYTSDENQTMAYKKSSSTSTTIDIKGNYKDNWIQTTYSNAGYAAAKDGLDSAAVTASADFINGGKYIQLSYTVTAGDTPVSDGKLAVHSDIQIGDNDSAAIEVIQDPSTGKVIGLKMVDTHTSCSSKDAQFNLYFDGTGGVTPVTTYWFGYYSDRTNSSSAYEHIYFAPLNDSTKSASNGTYEQVDGVYTKYSNADSGFAVSWQDITLAAGESKTFSFILGVGEKADPPQWSDNAVCLTLAADTSAEENQLLIDVSAKVKDAAGQTDTLYYSKDGGDSVSLGSVEADGTSEKTITGQLDLRGYEDGTHHFTFWVVNTAGAASPSVTKEIVISGGRITSGLDTEVPTTYTVTFDAQGGTVSPASSLTGTDGRLTGLPAPEREGYQFLGWFAASTGGSKVTTDTIFTADTTIYARWTLAAVDDSSAGDFRGITVEGLDDIVGDTTETTEVKLTVAAKDDVTGGSAAEDEALRADQNAIKATESASGKTLDFFDLALSKTVNNGTPTDIGSTNTVVLEIKVPFDFSGKRDVTVYRRHGNAPAETLAKVGSRPNTPFLDGQFYLDEDGGMIFIYASKFSTYAIGYTEEEPAPTPPSSGGSGGGVSSYVITVEDADHGTVKSDRTRASSGTTVTITITPGDGYALDDLTVTDAKGNELKLTNKGGGKYTFKMPASKVTVEAAFVLDGTADAPCGGGAGCPSRAFADLSTAAWYHEAVDYVLINGMMNGYADGTFRPSANLSRAMLAQMLYNMEGRPALAGGSAFTDVPDTMWCADAVNWAAAGGIVTGYGDNTFRPDSSITREQLAAMLYRYVQTKGGGFTGAWMFRLDFADAESVAGYAYEAVCWCSMKGVVNGYEDNTLRPKSNATRAQVAQMLKNFMEHVSE